MTVLTHQRRARARPLSLVAAMLVLGGAVAACSQPKTSVERPRQTTVQVTSPPASQEPSQPSPGCTAASRGVGPTSSSPTPGTTTVLQPVVSGLTRTAIVHLPNGYHAGTPSPLVLNLHGSQSTAAAQETFSGMDATSDEDGFIVAYPQGGIPAAGGFEWNVPGQPLFGGATVPSTAADDLYFLEQLVGLLEKRNCIDEHRVFATGFSGGARMASQLACDVSETFAAVAPVSGLRLPTPCPATRAAPVIAFHGTADPVDPYGGNGQAYWTYSVPEAAARWAMQDGCSAKASRATPSRGVVITLYGSCRDGAAVQLYSLVGEGHEWPGGPPVGRAVTRVLGPQSGAVDANSTMWAFFAAHPLPASAG